MDAHKLEGASPDKCVHMQVAVMAEHYVTPFLEVRNTIQIIHSHALYE